MEDITEHIWNYGYLSGEEQKKLHAFVREHPEYTDALEASRSMFALIDKAGLFGDDPMPDEALIYYVANQYVSSGVLPPILATHFKKVKQKMDSTPELRSRYEHIRARMEEVASHSNPSVQFEQLTGYSLERDFEENTGTTFTEDNRKWRGANDRSPGRNNRTLNKPSWRRSVMVSSIMVILLVGFLFYGNRYERIAYLPAEALAIDYELYRNGERLWDGQGSASADIVLRHAQWTFLEAQQVYFGVYHRFDRALLKEAEALIERVLSDREASGYLGREARYMLARVYIAQKNLGKARETLDDVISAGGPHASKAALLKERIK